MGNVCVAKDSDEFPTAFADPLRVSPVTHKSGQTNLSEAQISSIAEKIAAADMRQENLPIITNGPDAVALSLESAYAIQRQFVSKVGGMPSGYKQGFTTMSAVQKLSQFGQKALYGTLMPNTVHDLT